MATEADVSPPDRDSAPQVVQLRWARRRGTAVAVITAAAVVFVVVCVLVGRSAAAAHARANSAASPALPSPDTPTGTIAVLMAVALSLLATIVVLRLLAHARAADPVSPRECVDEDPADSAAPRRARETVDVTEYPTTP